MEEQAKLIHSGGWDVLVILDACRADYFEEVALPRLGGSYRRVRTSGPTTVLWLERTWPGRYEDIIYVSANPFVNSRGKPSHVKYDAREHFPAIVDAWLFGWDEGLNTVPPGAVNALARGLLLRFRRASPRPRLLVHYLQPHYPFIGAVGLPYSWAGLKKFLEADPSPYKAMIMAIKSGALSVEALREAYRANLRLVADYAAVLVREARDLWGRGTRIIITSDHGEMLGEHGEFFHEPWHEEYDEVMVVPWLEVGP